MSNQELILLAARLIEADAELPADEAVCRICELPIKSDRMEDGGPYHELCYDIYLANHEGRIESIVREGRRHGV